MRLSVIAALLGGVLAAGFSESVCATVIGPGDFGPDAIVQTFDSLPVNYMGSYGPLVLNGVTYATSSPDMYTIQQGPGCVSGQCFGTYVDSASFIITLDDPVERVGGFIGGQTPYVVFYDANHVALDGLNPTLSSDGMWFFGFQSDSNDIKYVEISPHSGPFVSTLDNFTYESVAAVPEPSTWAMLLFGFAAIGAGAIRRGRRLTNARLRSEYLHFAYE
jgi:hypothetical protein